MGWGPHAPEEGGVGPPPGAAKPPETSDRRRRPADGRAWGWGPMLRRRAGLGPRPGRRSRRRRATDGVARRTAGHGVGAPCSGGGRGWAPARGGEAAGDERPTASPGGRPGMGLGPHAPEEGGVGPPPGAAKPPETSDRRRQPAVALATSRRPLQVGLSAPHETRVSAVSRSRWTAAWGDSPWARSRATAPVTWGAAIDVPAR